MTQSPRAQGRNVSYAPEAYKVFIDIESSSALFKSQKWLEDNPSSSHPHYFLKHIQSKFWDIYFVQHIW